MRIKIVVEWVVWTVGVVLALSSVASAQTSPPAAATRPVRRQDAILPAINVSLPTLWIIGDSTVCNGQDRGENGQWGWGNPIVHYFDATKINVVNFALGGTSSRSFQESIRWERVLAAMKKGDYLIMQFGHNDGRGVLAGNGDEENPPGTHSHGWYMRKYVTDARAKGAKEVIICSLIPRNHWADGKVDAGQKYPAWDEEAAKQVNAEYVDLHGIIAAKYESLGQIPVTEAFFPEKETTHTDWAGAILNAQCVIEGIRGLPGSEIPSYLLPTPPSSIALPSGKAR